MKRQDFEEHNKKNWKSLENLLLRIDNTKKTTYRIAELPSLFRQVCCDLSLAQHRMYGGALCDYLNKLVIQGHKYLYRKQSLGERSAFRFIFVTLPREVRSQASLFGFASALFFIPFFLLMFSPDVDPIWVQSVLGSKGMIDLESMYSDSGALQEHRAQFDSNFKMFCFYIYNNISIDFRIFAGGLLYGIGTLFFLIFNGVYLGAAFGYVRYACDPQSLYTFVIGHSAFELVGMLLAGMGGLKMGKVLFNAGTLSRKNALAKAAKESLVYLYGAFGMTLMAAFIEGFWSALPISPVYKYTIGIAISILVAFYFLFSGRFAPQVKQ